MSGNNVSVLNLPPGIFSDVTQYGAGKHWFDGNLVRWLGEIMVPVGGWRAIADFAAAPVLNPQTPPAADLSNVVGPAAYTFSAVPLGLAVNKRVIFGLFIRFTAGGLTGNPTATVAGVNCTALYNVSFPATLVNIYISDGEIVGATGDIVVNVPVGWTATSCKIYPYEYVGPDPTVNGPRNTATGLTVTTTTKLTIPPLSKGLSISSALNVNDPILWTWPGSTVDNSEANAEQSSSMAHLLPVGLNTVDDFITQSGLLSAERSIRSTLLPTVVGVNPIRDMISWRDFLKAPWVGAGSADKLWALSVNENSTYTPYNITPTTLAWTDGAMLGFGSGPFGMGPFGIDANGGASIDAAAQWSMDNFGKLLIAVHSQDGRLFSWDPVTPATVAIPVAGAPIDNTLCIMSNEEFAIVLGGKNNPRRVKWASQRSLSDWTPTETNSAGGFDLQSHGAIRAAIKVPEGILVVTDADIHLLQHIGPPNYYGRRKISDEGSIIGKNALVAIPGGAMWMGNSDFWMYMGGNVVRMPCSVHSDAFYKSELSQPANVLLGVNEFAGEVWALFPLKGSTISDHYVAFSYAKEPYWSKGELYRTAWLNPVWQAQPLMAQEQMLYEHEYGALDNGVSRVGIFAETGAMEIGEGDEVMRVDRVWQDAGVQGGEPATFTINDPLAYTATFKLRQAPNAPERVYGPITLGDPRGYTTVRFRARQVAMRIDQAKDEIWTLGKFRMRVKAGGRR